MTIATKPREPSISLLLLSLLFVSAAPGCSLFSAPSVSMPSAIENILPGAASSKSRYVPVGHDVTLQSSGFTEDVYQAVRKAKQTNSIVLQVYEDSEALRILPLPSTNQTDTMVGNTGTTGGIFTSTLLKQTGVLKKYGKVQVAVFRPSPSSFDGVRMDVMFAPGSGREIRPESDYALRPGDRIVVRKDDRMSVDSLVDFAMGR